MKKIISFLLILCMAITSASNITAFAETATETAQPNILLYRDYEDYTGGTDTSYIFRNPDKKWGTWYGGNNGSMNKASTAVAGPYGIAVNIGAGNGYPNYALPSVLDSGVFYLAFDVEKETDAWFDENDGTTDGLTEAGKTVEHENYIYLTTSEAYDSWQWYARFGTAHSACADSVGSWNGYDLVEIKNLPSGYHRYELVVDLDNNTIVNYLDGVAVDEDEYTDDIKHVTFNVNEGIGKWDNFTVIHYPQNTAKTFSATAGGFDWEKDALCLDFASDDTSTSTKVETAEPVTSDYAEGDAEGTSEPIVETTTSGCRTVTTSTVTETVFDNAETPTTKTQTTTTTTTTAYKAPYPVLLSGVTDLKACFKVTDSSGEEVLVQSVTQSGNSYDIVLTDGIKDGETYTVTVTTGLANALGATVDASKTAVFKAPATQVLLYRDYEDYTGGAASAFNVKGGYTYGASNLYANSNFFGVADDIETIDGKGMTLNTYVSGDTKTTLGVLAQITLPKNYNNGKLYIRYDIQRKSDAEIEEMDGNKTTVHRNYLYVESSSGTQRYLSFYTQHSENTKKASWEGTGIGSMFLDENPHTVEFVLDLEANKISYYLDGTYKKGYSSFTFANIKKLQLGLTSYIKSIDNLAVIHYPEGTRPQTFSLSDGTADFADGTLSVRLRSDVKGSRTFTTGTKNYTAPYPVVITPLETADFKVTNSKGEAVEIKEVTAGTAPSEYKIQLADGLTENETYTVSATADRESVVGETLDKTKTAEIYVPNQGVTVSSIRVTSDESGTEADFDNVKSGDTLYVEVKYKNETGTDRTFNVLGAVYNYGRMSNVVVEEVTVLSTATDEITEYFPITVNDADTVSVKGFAFNNLAEMKPLAAQRNMLDGKKIIFIGNSFTYYGKVVLRKDWSILDQASRMNDTGYFYQLAKENGADVSVTNWTFGGHSLKSMFGGACDKSYSCSGENHLSYLTDRYYDYVVIQEGSVAHTREELIAQVESITEIFKEANPNVKFYFPVHHTFANGTSYAEVLETLPELEEMGIEIIDWGHLVKDIYTGSVEVPGATQEYNKHSFIIQQSATDGYHQNMLAGYITALMTYCVITNEQALGQPYEFSTDLTINSEFNVDSYLEKYYTYDGASSNFGDIMESETDMRGIQELIDKYLKEKPYRNY